MGQKYRHENTSVSFLNYHFVWTVRRRKKLLNGDLDTRLKALIHEAVSNIDCKVIALETHYDHVHLFVNAIPNLAPSQIMHRVKGYSSHVLREEYPWIKTKLPSLWTRSYLVSTAGNVSGDTIKRYVEEQKTR
ncbi:IS200/IS605 family transposase [Synechococcus sp. PCC 7335]|uniref:IS200/IS605 family transposase n=1 Tax=Synechococcus sp. (strain ATCC 29403 / PCC 7335) TaxID=91464 RepID=UPI00056E2261|nr:IS200/IS605 family transposase [Synechococcus sp. PCC 7335]